MPAVQMDKLRLESANLVGLFSQPDLFRYELLEMLEYYSNRTFRASQVTLPGKLLISFHVPDRVLWQIERDLESQINNYAQSIGLDCCALLWKSDSIEEKSLAVYILGKIIPDPPDLILDTLHRFYNPDLDPILRNILVSDGLAGIRSRHFNLWLDLITGWIGSDDPRQTAQAYQALTGLLHEEGDKHLPAISHMIQDNLFSLPTNLHPEALQLFQAMIRCSPVETRYILHQYILSAGTTNQAQKRLLRKMVELFPEPARGELRSEYLKHYQK